MSDKNVDKGYQKYESSAKDYLEKPEKIKELISKATLKATEKKNTLLEVWEQLHLLFDLVTSWRKGEYRKIPTRSIVMIVATVIYFVTPTDIVPDFLVGLGLVDDAAVIGFTLRQIASDLEKFQLWRQNNDKSDPE